MGSEESANLRKTSSIRVITLPLLSVVSSAPMRCESRRSSSKFFGLLRVLRRGSPPFLNGINPRVRLSFDAVSCVSTMGLFMSLAMEIVNPC
jgi:hypothetical protein